ncbi:cytochrome b561 [Ancylostoma ceylanicum]|uniref:Cytochrome b561 n=1 Tax=Ancylostoma ceylanicum TaxID=53326 RepID=A0A0D6LL02_9BILA|nr:cytochrome b561 [Ancylostoma ceylanicum]
MNKNAATTSTSSDGKLPKSYKRTLVVTQVAGVLMIILSSLWMGKFDDGFRLPEEPGIYYAYHVLLMTCSIAALGQSLLVFRLQRPNEKRKAYTKHVVFACASSLLMIIGILIRYGSRGSIQRPKAHATYYSIHPWVGLVTVMLCLVECFTALFVYVKPGVSKKMKEATLPCHIFIGVAIVAMLLVSVSFGIGQRSTSRWKREQAEARETPEDDLDEVTAPDLALNDADFKLGNSIIMQGIRETPSM